MIERKQWCGSCDCRTLQVATTDITSSPVWKCLNCLGTFARTTRTKVLSPAIENLFKDLTK